MTTKREFEYSDDGEISEPEPKRSKKQSGKARQHQGSSIDPTWGQKYVFSDLGNGTTIPAGEEDDFENDADAMAYLNSVRHEANGIPHLLVAPKVQIGPQLPADFKREDEHEEDDREPIDRSVYVNGTGDTRGYYEDGAYISVPQKNGDSRGDEEGEAFEDGYDELDEQEAIHKAYFASVADQYMHLRHILNSAPPKNAASRLSSTQQTFAAPFEHKSTPIAVWSRLLRASDPHPLQVALMSKDTVLRILRVLLGGKFLRRGYTLEERTSRWIWALLARLPDKGELNHTEIGWVRDLGRRAVLLGRSLAEMAALRDELEDGGLGAHERVDRSSSDDEVLADPESEEVEGAVSDHEEEDNAPEQNTEAATADSEAVAAPKPESHADDDDAEEGEVDEGEEDAAEDVAMDLGSDSDAQDDEVAADKDPQSDLQDAKSRLLAQLDHAGAAEEEEEEEAQEEHSAKDAARQRSRANLRVTLNMILTVAGEFYGQRDLLEFREPFVGM